jgi:hypothetical protein
MYVLVSTPTSADATPTTSTFSNIDTLWEHIQTLRGYAVPPTPDAESLGLSTENRYLKGILVDMYKRLDREFRSLLNAEQSMENMFSNTFLDPSPFDTGAKKVPNQDLRCNPLPTTVIREDLQQDFNKHIERVRSDITSWTKRMESVATRLPMTKEEFMKQKEEWKSPEGVSFFNDTTSTLDLSGNTVEYDADTTRVTYMTDIFKPDVLPKIGHFEEIAKEHNAENLLCRLFPQTTTIKQVYNQAKVDLFQKLFLDNFTKKIDGYNPNYKETFFSWVLFSASPQRFLADKGITFPVGLKDILDYDKPKLHDSFESLSRIYELNAEDISFKVFLNLLKQVIPANHKTLPFEKQRPWEKVCCDTMKTLYEIADGGKAKITADMLEPWIQFFLDAEIVAKKGQQIQSSVLFTDFCTYMTRVVKACDAETLFQPLIDTISIQHFSKIMKDNYRIKTQRKAAGNFYVDIDYLKNGSGQGLTTMIDAADFADLHREAKTESSWANAFGQIS